MKQNRTKTIFILLIPLVIVLTILLVLLLVFVFRPELRPGPEAQPTPASPQTLNLTLQYEIGEERQILYEADGGNEGDAEGGTYAPLQVTEPGGVLRLEAGDTQAVSGVLWLEQAGKTIEKVPFLLEEGQCSISLEQDTPGTYDVSFVLELKNKSKIYYVSTAAGFLEAVGNGEICNQTLYQMTDITVTEEIEEISVLYPFVWNMCQKNFSTKGKLHFMSATEGTMVIQNADAAITCGTVTCHTPLWDYEIAALFGNFSEKAYYAIQARSVNGKAIDTTTLTVDSTEKLEGILNDGVLHLDAWVNTVVFAGNMTVEGFTVTQPVSLRFEGDIAVSDGILVWLDGADLAAKEDTITIDTAQNATDLQQAIWLEAPGIHVIWQGKTPPAFDYIQQYMNVKSYNGKALDAHLGGTGSTKLLSGSLHSRKHAGKEVALQVEGNYIYVTFGYTNAISWDDAILKAKLDGEGSAAIREVDGKYYCVVTDQQQRERAYQLQAEYKDYTLPVIYITTENGKAVTSKEVFVNGSFSMDYNGNGTYANLTDLEMQIRGRGHSSWELAKKPYKLKFAEKTSLFGLTAAKEWVLQANHIDRSLMRNNLAMQMGSLLQNMAFIPHSYMVDVFVNGTYQGVYSLTEQIEMKAGRVPGQKDSTEVDADYLLEFAGDLEETSFGSNIFSTTLCKYVEIKTPDSDVISYEQYQYIKGYFQELDNAIMELSDYEAYIDIPSLIDWFILHEFSYNTDCTLRRSNFFLKKQGGKLYVAAPWDFDYAFGNMGLDSNNYQEWICLGNAKTDAYNNYIATNWMDYLLKDKNFTNQLKARWEEVGQALYQKALETIDANAAHIGLSAEENFSKWNKCLGVKLQYESKKTVALDTYEEQVTYLKEFIKKRYAWMDKTIKAM